MSEDGSVIVGVAISALALALAVGLAAVGQMLVARATAVAAADAAALAAAPVTFREFGSDGDPLVEARRFAEDNGARLVTCRCAIDRTYAARTVTVVVNVDVALLATFDTTVEATSAAEFRPSVLLED